MAEVRSTVPETSAEVRRQVIDLLNVALSAEYHSFVGHALGSNPFVAPGTEKDLDLLLRIRGEENENVRALLIQLGRYRAGPTIRAFRLWKHDLNFLGLDFLVMKAAEVAKEEVARVEKALPALPDDAELRATFTSILVTKRRHAEELGKVGAQRAKERAARRAAARAVTTVAMKKPTPAAAPAAKPAAGAPGAPAAPGAPKAPSAPGAPKAPPMPGAPKPPSPPLPGAPKAPSPPLPPGATAPKAPSPPLPPGSPSAPKPPSPPVPPGAAAKPSAPPLPPGFKMPPKPPAA